MGLSQELYQSQVSPRCMMGSKTPLDQIGSSSSCRLRILALGAFIIFLQFAKYLQRTARAERGCSWQEWEACALEETIPTPEPRDLISQGSASRVHHVGRMEHGHFYPRSLSRLRTHTHTHAHTQAHIHTHSQQQQEPKEAKLTALKITPGFRVQFKSHCWELPRQPAGWGAGLLPTGRSWLLTLVPQCPARVH